MYLPPIVTAPKWWPDRRAFATGFAVVGLGLGSFIMAPLATIMVNHFGSVLPVFKYVGIAMGIMVVLASLCLKVPPAGWNPPSAAGGTSATKVYRDYTYEETKKNAQFWLLWVAYFCGSFAGLMVIDLIAKHGIDAMTIAYKVKEGLDAAANVAKNIAMAAVGAPSALAIFNALVRIMIGPLADKIGNKKIFVTLFILQVVAMLLLFPAGKTVAMLAAVAGFFGPYLGGRLQAMTGSFFIPFVVSAVVLAIAVVILATIKAPERKAV